MLVDSALVRLMVALGQQPRRSEAAQALAKYLGARGLVIFIEDREAAAMVPIQGMPRVPGGLGWRDILDRCRAPGLYRGTVSFPDTTTTATVLALSGSGAVFVLLEPEREDEEALRSITALLPLVAWGLLEEHAAANARGELKLAQQEARQGAALARALNASRAEVEHALRRLEEQARTLDEARSRAEQATRAKDEFLAMLGHELRNPLAPIAIALQLLRRGAEDTRDRQVAVIERQVGHLIRLVDDLLDVARLTRGRVELRKQRVELAEITRRAVEMASPLLEQKRQVLTIRVPEQGLLVEADPSRLAQVLSNLLTNAAKYSDPGSPVSVAAERQGDSVIVSVADQGMGIPPAMLDQIFELFVQQEQGSDRALGGLGLGLTIVRRLVELHGGVVRARSEGLGRGSEFTVTLPAVERDFSAPVSSPVTPASLPRQGLPTRVMLVDDNPDVLATLGDALESLGYAVRQATDGPGALRAAEEFAPQVALVDIGLPVMDGYELAVRLREVPGGRDLRLIALTGYGQESDRRRSHDAGFAAHLVKPINLDDLDLAIRGQPSVKSETA